MAQQDIIKLLEENIKIFEQQIKLIDKKVKQQDIIFIKSLNKKEITQALGICLQAVTNNITRLVKQEHVKVLRDEKDKRQTRYVINNDLIKEIFGEEKK